MRKLLFSFLVIGGLLLFCVGARAAEEIAPPPEIPSSTPEIPTSTPSSTPEDTSTATPAITPTTTPDTTPTTTTDVPTTTPTSTPEIPTTTPEIDHPTGSSDDHAGPAPVSIAEIQNTVQKILAFLRSKQDSDGKIIDAGTSDWAAMSFGADGIYADDVKTNTTSLLQYIYNTDPNSEANMCAAYPRHILALLASGIAKNDSKIINIKNKMIAECNIDGGYGQDKEINDDIFGLIALSVLKEDADQQFIQKIITTITHNQQTDGSFTFYGWAGADVTGAAINALQYAQNNGAEVNAETITKAKQYLKSSQLADGGWGWGPSDSLNTSWALMGINALGDNQNDWFNTTNSTGKNPWHVLLSQINTGGYYETTWSTDGVDWFGTKHAVPALLGKSWPIILPTRIPILPPPTTNGYQPPTTTPDPVITPTTTPLIPTTTPDMATTTPLMTTTTMDITTSATSTLETTTTTPDQFEMKQSIQPNNYRQKKVSGVNRALPPAKKPPNTSTASSTDALSASLTPPATTPTKQILDQLPLDTPTRQAAKKILTVTGGSTIAMGLYLGLKFLKTLI